MGTQILHSKRYSTGYCSSRGRNSSVSNYIWSEYHEDKAPINNQYGDSLLPRPITIDRSIEYNKEKVRQTILKHESVFRHQLQELHHLYGRQKELMDEFRRREGQMKAETSNLSPCDDDKFTQHSAYTPMHLVFSQASTSESADNKSLSGFSKEKGMLAFPSRWNGNSEICEPPHSNGNLLQRKMIDLESPPEVDIDHENVHVEDRFSGLVGDGDDALRSSLHLERKNELADLNQSILLEDTTISSSAAISNSILHPAWSEPMRPGAHSSILQDGCPTSSPVASLSSPAQQIEFSTSEIRKAERKTKRKLFGLDIFEVHDESLVTHTNKVIGTSKYDQLSSKPSHVQVKDCVDSGRRLSFSSSVDGVLHQNDLSLGPQLNSRLSKRNSAIDSNSVITSASTLVHDVSPPTHLVHAVEGLDCFGWRFSEVTRSAKITSNTFQDNVAAEHDIFSTDCQQNILKGSPVHLIKTKYGFDRSRANNNSYHLNLDSLQHNSQHFFKKTKVTSFFTHNLTDKQEIMSPLPVHENEEKITEVDKSTSIEMNSDSIASNALRKSNDLTFVTNSDRSAADWDTCRDLEVEKAGSGDEAGGKDIKSEEPVNNCLSGLRCCIDLNLPCIEEEAPSVPSPPAAVVKLATTEENLEVPVAVVLESKSDKGTRIPSAGSKVPCDQELIKQAAEAIVAISVSGEEHTAQDPAFISLEETPSDDCLTWFVDVVSSFERHDQTNMSGDTSYTEDLIPAGMDYFEFMTLKLKDAKCENYFYNYEAPILGNQDNKEHVTTLSRRTRRGQARRGRQCKDFQRDILPHLISLSKFEVTEDFQMFEEVLRATGCNWETSLKRKSSAKNGRGRRRSGVTRSSLKPNAIYPSQEQKPVSVEVKLDRDKPLSGWGKRTRRLPRQRSRNGTSAP